MSNSNRGGRSAPMRNALLLYLPFLFDSRERGARGSVMMGFLPGTKRWRHVYEYENVSSNDLAHHWVRFFVRHGVAEERATVLRDLLRGESALLINRNEDQFPVSLRWPEIKMVVCVGKSMLGEKIYYMDALAIYPAQSQLEVNVDLDRPTRLDGNDKIFENFEIHIGDGVVIRRDHLIELRYLKEMIDEAKSLNAGCPPELSDRIESIQKIRLVNYLRISEAGEKHLGVTMHRSELEPGLDHPLTNIKGRAFSHYNRFTYENRLRESGRWSELSFPAQVPDLLEPEHNWDKIFAEFTEHERIRASTILLNEDPVNDLDGPLVRKLEEINASLVERNYIPERRKMQHNKDGKRI